jgi:hypothetical protein
VIFGIDPGPLESAYCIWDGEHILKKGIRPNREITACIPSDFYLAPGETLAVACEHIQCMGMPVGASVFETAYWIGDFRSYCRWNKTLFLPVYRSEVKMHFCGNMRAKDAHIRQALIDRLGPPGTKKAPGVTYGVKGDIWSALAIAVMVEEKRPTNAI